MWILEVLFCDLIIETPLYLLPVSTSRKSTTEKMSDFRSCFVMNHLALMIEQGGPRGPGAFPRKIP